MELNDIKDKLQLVEEALGYVAGIKLDAEEMEYQADDLQSQANTVYDTAGEITRQADEAIGQLEYARDEIRSYIIKEENNAITAS